MTSKATASFIARPFRNSDASLLTTSISSLLTFSDFRFVSINAYILRERSTKVTCAAPRDSASIPTAPDPAHRSRNRAPLILGARILNSVSRKRSEVGRVCEDGGLFSFRPRYLPAMIRTFSQSADCADYTDNRIRQE